MFIFVNHGEWLSFLSEQFQNLLPKATHRSALHQTPVFVVSAFVLDLEITMDVVKPKSASKSRIKIKILFVVRIFILKNLKKGF